MTSGKQSFDQRSEDTKTIEDRDYFTLGPNIFNRSDFLVVLNALGCSPEIIKKRTAWPGKVDPYWVDQIREGWTQWQVTIDRDRTVKEVIARPKIQLYYNNASPYCWWFPTTVDLAVVTLAKTEEQAIEHTNKVLTQQYLNPKWLAMKENDDFYGRPY